MVSRLQPALAALEWRRRAGPDIGRQRKHHRDSLAHGFVARTDAGALKDQTEAPAAWPRQCRQSGLKVQPRDGGHTGALCNLVDFFSKSTQVPGNMTGRQI